MTAHPNTSTRQLKHRSAGFGTCLACGARFARGEWMIRVRTGKFEHVECPPKEKK